MALKLLQKTRKAALLTMLALALCITQTQAQDPGDGGLGDPDGTSVPIDGGLSILLGLGAAVGAKKIYNKAKGKKNEEQK